MSQHIYKLIGEGEHQQLDFKFEISDAKKIAKTLVAFSNTDGGKLLVGVKDNGKIAGIRTDEEYYMLDSAASLFCKPAVKPEYTRWVIDGKTILEVTISEGEQKPYLCQIENGKWMAFIRSKDENFLADVVQLKAWKYKRKDSGILLKYTSGEQKVLDQFTNSDALKLTDLINQTGLKRRIIIDILSKLVSFNLIKVQTSHTGTIYIPLKEEY